MGWVRLDDSTYDHPKMQGRSKGAKAAFAEFLGWSNKYLTDGFIPQKVVTQRGYTLREARELVHADLWEAVTDGFQIHDYLDYQPSRHEIQAKRAKRATSARNGGLEKAARGKARPLPLEMPSKPASKPPSTLLPRLPSKRAAPIPIPDPNSQENNTQASPSASPQKPTSTSGFTSLGELAARLRTGTRQEDA